MRDLSILLTLKDREDYTQRWLDQNVFPEFSYLIADGSLSSGNEEIFKNYKRDNVKYIRFIPDSTYPIYIQKRLESLKKITSRFVLYADNDDFLLRSGLNKIMDFLEENPSVTLVQGNVGRVAEQASDQFLKLSDWHHYLSSGSRHNNIKQCLLKYYSLFYCISETKIQMKIFEIFVASGTESPYLVEEFQTYFSIAMSKFEVLPIYYYLRLANSVGSQDSGFSEKHKFDLCLDRNFHRSFYYLVNKLAGYFPEHSEEELIKDLRDYQISKIKTKQLRLKEQLILALKSRMKRLINIFTAMRKQKLMTVDTFPNIFH